jgi:hypothetical protein
MTSATKHFGLLAAVLALSACSGGADPAENGAAADGAGGGAAGADTDPSSGTRSGAGDDAAGEAAAAAAEAADDSVLSDLPSSAIGDDDPVESKDVLDPFAPDAPSALPKEENAVDGAKELAENDIDSKLAQLDHIESVHSNTDKFTRTGWTFVSELQMCMKYSISGRFTYTSEKLAMFGGETGYRLRHITLAAPRTSATLYGYDPGTHACMTNHEVTLNKLTVREAFAGYACTYNPQISVYLPLQVGLGFWPNCGEKKAARHSASDTNEPALVMSNPDARAHFSDQVRFTYGSSVPGFRCYGAAMDATIGYHRYSVTKKSPRRKVCLTPVW